MQTLSGTRFIILDTETTGNSTDFDKPIEIAAVEWKNGKAHKLESKPVWSDVPIKPSASAVHHLTPKDIEGADDYNSVLQYFIKFIGHSPLVIHNKSFDLAMLPYFKETNHPTICSLRLARQLWPLGEKNADGFPLLNHQAQTLRYWLDLNVDTGGLAAHRAGADILVTGAIFQVAVDKYLSLGYPDDLKSFMDFVDQPIQYPRMPYGTHAGKNFEDLPNGFINYYLDRSKNPNPDPDVFRLIQMESVRRIQHSEALRKSLPSNIAKANSF